MKILIISYYFPPINSIASLRPYSWAKYWSQMGHDVTVLTVQEPPRDNDLQMDCTQFRTIRVANPIKNSFKRFFRSSAVDSIPIESKGSSNPGYLSKIKSFLQSKGIMATARMPDMNDFIITASYDKVASEYFDLVVSTAGPYSEHLIAKKLKDTQKTAFWIADYRDLWTQNHIFKGLFPFTLIEEYLEKQINRSADLITTVSKPLAKQIAAKYALHNVSVIENGFDTDDLELLPTEPYWHDKKTRLVYTGAIYKGKRDPSPLFEAIAAIRLSDEADLLNELEVIFVGGNKADLEDLIVKYDVNRWVSYGGFLPREDALRMHRDADALIFLEFEGEGVDGILTGKLFEYFSSGTEIMGIGVTDKSTPGELIRRSGQGINFGKESQKIADYLKELLQRKTKKTGIRNDFALETYSRKKLAEKMLLLIHK